jgi:Domain of Unknown Function (DUF1080)
MINRAFRAIASQMVWVCILFLPAYSFADDPLPNTLTAEEVADGWLLLFDGKTVSEWRIEGDHEIVEGVLILGGKNKTRAYLPKTSPANGELRYQYRINEKSGAVVGCDWREKERSPVAGFSFQILSESHDWHDSFIREYRQFRFPMSAHPMIEHPNGINGVFGAFESFWIEVPAGQKLQLRNVRWRPDPSPWVFIAGIPLLSVGLLLLLVWVWRKKWGFKTSKIRTDEPKHPPS